MRNTLHGQVGTTAIPLQCARDCSGSDCPDNPLSWYAITRMVQGVRVRGVKKTGNFFQHPGLYIPRWRNTDASDPGDPGVGKHETMITTDSKTEAATHKRARLPVLGATLLMMCLLAGFAQAADSDTGPVNSVSFASSTSPAFSGVLASSEIIPLANQTGSESSDVECTSHTIACYDYRGVFLGNAGSGCYWNFWGCEDSAQHMLKNCRDKYGNTVEAADDVTPCRWE